MEEVDIIPTSVLSKGLDLAIDFLKNSVANLTSTNVACSQQPGCLEITRKLVLQLKMLEWGILGLGDGLAGSFQAYHYSTIGKDTR